MAKRIIRLTESDIHRIVKESVNRILNEENYFTPNGSFNSAAYMYDEMMRNAKTLEEYEQLKRERDEYLKTAFNNGIGYHPQTSRKTVASTKYAHPGYFGINSDDVLNDFQKSVEHNKMRDFAH